MRWYQGWSINKFQLVAIVIIPIVSVLLYLWFNQWERSQSPFHPIEVDPAITAVAPADPAARLNELLLAYRGGSFRVNLTEDVRFGNGQRLSYDRAELVWSRIDAMERFDAIGVNKGVLDGQSAIDAGGTSGASSYCHWQLAAASESAVTSCRPGLEDFTSTILYGVISELLDAPPQGSEPTKVAFYGYTTRAGNQGECFSLQVGFYVRPAGVLCLTAGGVPLAIEGDLQQGYYHVSLLATEVGVPPTVEQLTQQVVLFPDNNIDYTQAPIALAQMTLPSTPLVHSFTGR